jgi:hypothetical protein
VRLCFVLTISSFTPEEIILVENMSLILMRLFRGPPPQPPFWEQHLHFRQWPCPMLDESTTPSSTLLLVPKSHRKPLEDVYVFRTASEKGCMIRRVRTGIEFSVNSAVVPCSSPGFSSPVTRPFRCRVDWRRYSDLLGTCTNLQR